jgi:signal transduction histidine kinase
MIDITGNTKGFALLCDENGKIKDLLRNDIGLDAEQIRGKLFPSLVEQGSRPKAINFLMDIRTNEVAFNYQMIISINKRLETISFIGINLKNEIIIVGAGDEQEVIEFTNQLQKINNEQANLIRNLIKEKLEIQNKPGNESENSWDDLTKLNNELINLQRELSKKNTELERLNETKNHFLGMAAHDMRSPLAIIYSYTEYLIDNARQYLPEKQQKFLQTVFAQSEFMLTLIDDLLDVSKIESGKLELKKEPFDLISFATGNIELNNSLAVKKNIQINMKSDFDSLQIYADRHKIEQVFNNLLSNAVKFSYPDSSVEVGISSNRDEVQISFKDHGTGIQEEKLENIFQPYKMASGSGTSGEKGTGLGLQIVKKIIEGHGGTIKVESEPGKGSTFFVTLPLEKLKNQEERLIEE